MEHSLADQPQKAVHACPEHGYLGQGLGPPVKQGDLPDDIAEAQDQTSHYDSRDQGGKYLRQAAHDPLKHVLVLFGRLFHRILGHAFNPCHCHKIIVKCTHFIADNNLELSRLCKCALGGRQGFNGPCICLGRIIEHKPHPCNTVGNSRYILPSSHILQQLLRILGKSPCHNYLLRLKHLTLTCFFAIICSF